MKRSFRACVHCHTRKVRCNVDHGVPCYNCINDGVACRIPERKRGANGKGAKDQKNFERRRKQDHRDVSDEDLARPDRNSPKSLQRTERELAEAFRKVLLTRCHYIGWLCSQSPTTTKLLGRRIMLIERSYAAATFNACLAALREAGLYNGANSETLGMTASGESEGNHLDLPFGDEQTKLLQRILRLPLLTPGQVRLETYSEDGSPDSAVNCRLLDARPTSPVESCSSEKPLRRGSATVALANASPLETFVVSNSEEAHGTDDGQEVRESPSLDDLFHLLVDLKSLETNEELISSNQ